MPNDLLTALCPPNGTGSDRLADLLGEIRDRLASISLKGVPQTVLTSFPGGRDISSQDVAMDLWNAALVVFDVSPWIAANNAFTWRIQGSVRGSAGFFDLPDAQSIGGYAGGTNHFAIPVSCGASRLRVSLTNWASTTPDPTGGGVTVTVIPYQAGGFTTSANREGARRSPTITYRSNITALDLLSPPTIGVLSSVTDTGGQLVAGTSYSISAAEGNRWGVTTAAAPASIVVGTGNNAVRVPLTLNGNPDYVDLFLSGGNAAWVGRVTPAQISAGGYAITAVGTVSSGFSNPAGTIDILVPGTGVAYNANPFLVNDAYVLPNVPPIIVAGYELLHLFVKVTATNPNQIGGTMGLAFFVQPQSGGADWYQQAHASPALNIGGSPGNPLEQSIDVYLLGSTAIHVLVDQPPGSGTGWSISLLAELS